MHKKHTVQSAYLIQVLRQTQEPLTPMVRDCRKARHHLAARLREWTT